MRWLRALAIGFARMRARRHHALGDHWLARWERWGGRDDKQPDLFGGAK